MCVVQWITRSPGAVSIIETSGVPVSAARISVWPGKQMSGGAERFLVERRRADRVHLADERQRHGALDETERRIACHGRELAERQIVRDECEIEAIDRVRRSKRASARLVDDPHPP